MQAISNVANAPYTVEQVDEYRKQFLGDGFLHIPNVLSREEVATLKQGIDRVFEDKSYYDTDNLYGEYVSVRLFETDPMFVDMLTREPIIGLMESILGPNCHLVAQNAVRNRPGEAIDWWHVDDEVIFPVAEGMDAHDPRLQLPLFICTVQIPLTDIPSDEYGPTQYVPGSHYSGRHPNETLEFQGQGPTSVHCQAGDIYLHNGQCWHHGAPNTSDRTRYLLQQAYGARFISQRFYPFVNYQLPQHVLDGADDRLKRVLGFHSKGAYG